MSHDLDRAPLVAVAVLPRAAPQASVDADAPALREVATTELGLLVPGGHAEEVGFLASEPVHREQEVGDLAVVAELLDLHVRGEISRQHDTVHSAPFVGSGDNVVPQVERLCVGLVSISTG